MTPAQIRREIAERLFRSGNVAAAIRTLEGLGDIRNHEAPNPEEVVRGFRDMSGAAPKPRKPERAA